MLPALGKDVAHTLTGEHNLAVAAVKRVMEAKRDEPEEPSYEQYKPDPKLVKVAAGDDEEAAEEAQD